mmetsp:Transcript_116927/g.325877  ORF Transcript_116927/g.325877 Transcript_116927/m.325877 type:complete len:245 (+) Transcript_116927:209-943(+)
MQQLPARSLDTKLQERVDEDVCEDSSGPVVYGDLHAELRVSASCPLHGPTAEETGVPRRFGGRHARLPMLKLQEARPHRVRPELFVVHVPPVHVLRQKVDAGPVQRPPGVASVVNQCRLRARGHCQQRPVHVRVADDTGLLAPLANVRRHAGALAEPLSGVVLGKNLRPMATEDEEELVPRCAARHQPLQCPQDILTCGHCTLRSRPLPVLGGVVGEQADVLLCHPAPLHEESCPLLRICNTCA